MFPEINFNNTENIENREEKFGITYLFDFEKSEFIIQDGKLIEANELESVKIWIEKKIRTDKFKFKVYKKDDNDDEYGVTIKNLLGKKLPEKLIQSEIKRELEKEILVHPKINKLKSWNILVDGSKVQINFTVDLLDSEKEEVEVNIGR